MTLFGVDIMAVSSAGAQIQSAAAEFGQGRIQVAGTDPVSGGSGEATFLLERLLAALGDALGKAEAELQQIGGHLAATADAYTRTEQALSAWRVPGMAAGGGS